MGVYNKLVKSGKIEIRLEGCSNFLECVSVHVKECLLNVKRFALDGGEYGI